MTNLLLAFAFCCLVLDSTPKTTAETKGTLTLTTSWYGGKFHGRTMANGEKFNRHNPTNAAHRSWPLGTKVLLTNQQGQRLEIEITDRGPYSRDRDLDVSEAAAEILGFKQAGVTQLQATKLKD